MYEKFEHILQMKGISSYQVAKGAGISQTMLSNWKSGKSVPKSRSLQKIADYLEVSVDYLMNGKEGEDYEADLKKSRDLKVQFDQIRRLLQTSKMQPLYFDGQEVDQESIDLLMKQVEVSFAIIQRATE